MTEPLCILIGALGGEGGGVLADWLTRAAEASGYPVQRTSIPGVAQRTGATSYYVEIFPIARARPDGKEPVLALSPVPGKVDVMIASELLEAARAAQAGLVTAARTVLIASNHRVYTVAEKSAMGDGRFDAVTLAETLERLSRRAHLLDMEALAKQTGTVISAVMLGAIAGAAALPLARSAFEDAIRASGKGIESSLAGFAAGFAAMSRGAVARDEVARVAGLNARRVPRAAQAAIDDIRRRFPESLCALVEEGYLRQLDYQHRRYADLYLARVERTWNAERARSADRQFPVTRAYARFLALWMSYEDVVRVADLKNRARRFERLRAEVAARPGDGLKVIEFLKPGLEEWCAVLPPGMAARLRRVGAKRGWRFNVALRLNSTSIHGALMLRMLGGLRWWRPYTSRYADEQRLIERWSAAVLDALTRRADLALELALCGRLIKGYGDTHARGKANFLRVLELYDAPTIRSDADRVGALRAAREAALADPEGKKFDQALAAHGIAPRPIAVQPIVWHGRGRAA